MDFSSVAIREWRQLTEYSKTRRRELSQTFSPLVDVINSYEQLACRLILVLGTSEPGDKLDDALRDLFAEGFDAMRTSKCLSVDWLPSLTIVLLRRAYEVTSLFDYLMLNPSQINKWDQGKKIPNHEIRKFLANHPMGEREEHLKSFYSILSEGTHVNREFVPHRQLGLGNQFTLGSISHPLMTIVCQQLLWLVSIWFWLMALATYQYKELLDKLDPGFGDHYMSTAKNAMAVVKDVENQWQDLEAIDKS